MRTIDVYTHPAMNHFQSLRKTLPAALSLGALSLGALSLGALSLGLFASNLSAQSLITTVPSNGAADLFGTSVAFIGDINNDNYPDYVVGAPGSHGFSTGYGYHAVTPGYANVYSGATHQMLYHHIFTDAGDAFGTSVASIGDFDGDSIPDYAIGSTDAGGYHSDSANPPSFITGPSAVRFYSGATGALLYTHAGSFTTDAFIAIDGIGDLDNQRQGRSAHRTRQCRNYIFSFFLVVPCRICNYSVRRNRNTTLHA